MLRKIRRARALALPLAAAVALLTGSPALAGDSVYTPIANVGFTKPHAGRADSAATANRAIRADDATRAEVARTANSAAYATSAGYASRSGTATSVTNLPSGSINTVRVTYGRCSGNYILAGYTATAAISGNTLTIHNAAICSFNGGP